ncbi:MAG: twin-arginine translocase TatA/TatE family subunit [Acidimicrobiia bacterium]
MGSLGTGEIVVIVLVALIIFGPHRIPEISRKAGQLLAQAREMSRSVTDSFGDELNDITAPIKDLKSEYDSTMGEMKSAASSVAGMSIEIPEVSLNPKDLLKSKPAEAAVTETVDEKPDAAAAEAVVEDSTGPPAVAAVVEDAASESVEAAVVESDQAGTTATEATLDEEAS